MLKLKQGQVWKKEETYLRIVHLERLAVEYKAMTDLITRDGTHHHVTKKEFCRLLKNAVLQPPDERRKGQNSSEGAPNVGGEASSLQK